jgi:hypothetical protein
MAVVRAISPGVEFGHYGGMADLRHLQPRHARLAIHWRDCRSRTTRQCGRSLRDQFHGQQTSHQGLVAVRIALQPETKEEIMPVQAGSIVKPGASTVGELWNLY